MKIKLLQLTLLISVLGILIPTSSFALSPTKGSYTVLSTEISLLDDPTCSNMDTLSPNDFDFKDRKGQFKAIRKVKHEYYLAALEERRRSGKDNFGIILGAVLIICFGLFMYVGYQACADLD